jgi:hypothetical protein
MFDNLELHTGLAHQHTEALRCEARQERRARAAQPRPARNLRDLFAWLRRWWA